MFPAALTSLSGVKVLLFGATGMIGQGVLRECLLDAGVTEVVTVGRSRVGKEHPKLRDLLMADFASLDLHQLRRVLLLPWRVGRRHERGAVPEDHL